MSSSDIAGNSLIAYFRPFRSTRVFPIGPRMTTLTTATKTASQVIDYMYGLVLDIIISAWNIMSADGSREVPAWSALRNKAQVCIVVATPKVTFGRYMAPLSFEGWYRVCTIKSPQYYYEVKVLYTLSSWMWKWNSSWSLFVKATVWPTKSSNVKFAANFPDVRVVVELSLIFLVREKCLFISNRFLQVTQN